MKSSSTSLSSLSETSTLRKHKFDDRSLTRVSLLLKLHSSPAKPSLLDAPPDDFSTIQWLETSAIGATVNSAEFLVRHGAVTCIEACAVYIAAGTDKGFVVVFNYHQQIECVLAPDAGAAAAPTGAPVGADALCVTTVAFSSDCTVVAAGYSSGHLMVWELETAAPFFCIKPITLQMRFEKGREGHIADNPITAVRFLGSSNHQLVSVDLSGLAFYHHGFKKFLQRHFVTHKLLGKNDTNSDIKSSSVVYDVAALPLGTASQLTDALGVLAVITGGMVAVVSTLSLNNEENALLRTHYRIAKPRALVLNPSSVGCISWYPCMSRGDGVENAKLAYSWNNCISVLEIDNSSFPPNIVSVVNDLKDKDKGVPTLPISPKARYVFSKSHNIISINWTSESTICVFSQNSKSETNIHILYYNPAHEKPLDVIGREQFPHGQISQFKFSKKDEHLTRPDINDLVFQSYSSTVKIVKHRAIVLAQDSSSRKQIHIGRPISWADKLVKLLQQQDYYDALSRACFYFNSKDVGHSVLLGMPADDNQRKALVKPYLIKIMNESLPHLFEADRTDAHEKYTKLYFEIIVMLELGRENQDELQQMLENVYEMVDNKAVFFSALEDYLYDGSISVLPPIILKQLVQHYAENNKGEILTEILCIIDLSSLDIDLTIHLCRKYHLEDCLIFVWNFLLHDYTSPFYKFIREIAMNPSNEENLRVFTYMAYILTGRQYPIDRYIDHREEEIAKNKLCSILFSHSWINGPENEYSDFDADEETIFPYLYLLLKFNSFEMLSTLNEFFEDSVLNDSSGNLVTRQYIVEALLDVFDSHKEVFKSADRTNFSIFVARNYPKYSQFLRLSDSVLKSVIDDLLNCTDDKLKTDCELALQSLLSAYEPEDEAELIERLKFARYFNVLINIYKAEGKFHHVLNLWLEKHDQGLLEDFGHESFSVILEDALRQTKPGSERTLLLGVVKEKFERLCSIDTHIFVYLVSRFEPSLHSQALKVADKEIKFVYLQEFFQETSFQRVSFLPELIFSYIELLFEFDPEKVYDTLVRFMPDLKAKPELLSQCKQLLVEKDAIDSLTIILLDERQYEHCLELVLDHLKNIACMLPENRNQFEKYFQIFAEVCEIPETNNDVPDNELSLNESMWLKVIHQLIAYANQDANEKQFFNEKIYESFRRISDSKLNRQDRNEGSFFKIFNKFLEASQDVTTLSNIRVILQEVIVAYSYESETLKIGSKIINEGIYKRLKIIKVDSVKGWSIRNRSCTSCGKKMIDSSTSQEHWVAWEQHQLESLSLMKRNDFFDYAKSPNQVENGQLIYFKCGHGYHHYCLKKMKSRYCILCVQE